MGYTSLCHLLGLGFNFFFHQVWNRHPRAHFNYVTITDFFFLGISRWQRRPLLVLLFSVKGFIKNLIASYNQVFELIFCHFSLLAEILNTMSKSFAMVQMYDFWSTFAECFTRYDNHRVLGFRTKFYDFPQL